MLLKLLLAIVLLAGAVNQCQAQCGDHVTIKELEQLFIGRCLDFQWLHKQSFCPDSPVNCTDLWTKFLSAFNDKPECNVTYSYFNDFITAAVHPIEGKQLFWSGVYGFAQRFSDGGYRYTTLEDTLIGHLLNEVSFCGGTAGANASTSCPRRNDTCPSTASDGFWTAASINFARKAAGHIYVLLNATRDPITSPTSYFLRHEVPNLRNGSVTRLTAYLINESPGSVKACQDDVLKQLKADLMARGISFGCEENTRELLLTYCAREENGICKGFISSASVPSLTDYLSVVLVMTVFNYLL